MGPEVVVFLGSYSAELLRILKGSPYHEFWETPLLAKHARDEWDMQDACGNNAYRHLVKEIWKGRLLQICDVRVSGNIWTRFLSLAFGMRRSVALFVRPSVCLLRSNEVRINWQMSVKLVLSNLPHDTVPLLYRSIYIHQYQHGGLAKLWCVTLEPLLAHYCTFLKFWSHNRYPNRHTYILELICEMCVCVCVWLEGEGVNHKRTINFVWRFVFFV